MLPVAPGAKGQPPSPPMDDSNRSIPSSEPGHDVAKADAARVVEVKGDGGLRETVAQVAAERAHEGRGGHPGGVAEADPVEAELLEPLRDVADPLEGDVAFERAAEGGRDRAVGPARSRRAR